MRVLYSAPPRLDIRRVFLTICACPGLENYHPGESVISRSFGRFPMHSKFVSDYIVQVAGRRNRRHRYCRQPLLRWEHAGPYHGLQLSPRRLEYPLHYQSPATWCFLVSTSLVFDLSPVVPRLSSPVVPRSSSALAACSWTSSYMDSLVYLLATSLSALSRNLVMCSL
ncbi:hypothetical protein L227DRAFT_581879 [Lentinus tigrinus ALCF2SS1-6]|uniref:Uncharacterized protein n=1 Tax=Lentinus tigrinus ALCF2SS1-6 TaxID=1328759 RepID=A0A5C2RMI3_9APHY|nr:hypothetical protein L227DRAFT_581879 [Lentinus tigrinus ALCF2SS1-6]